MSDEPAGADGERDSEPADPEIDRPPKRDPSAPSLEELAEVMRQWLREG